MKKKKKHRGQAPLKDGHLFYFLKSRHMKKIHGVCV